MTFLNAHAISTNIQPYSHIFTTRQGNMKCMNRCPCVLVIGLQCSAFLVNQTAPKCVSDHIRLQNQTIHQHLRIFTHFRCTSILQWFSSKGSLLLHCCTVQFDYLLDIMHGLEIKGVFTQPTDFNKRNLNRNCPALHNFNCSLQTLRNGEQCSS